MRITGGTIRGRTVRVPPGVIRPAMDRMRESLFSILEPIGGSSFLDLFCGSGIMALEALSRGAASATLVESDRRKRRVIEANMALADDTGSGARPRVIFAPVERFVQRERAAFDLIYADPPFAYHYKQDLLQRVARSRLVKADTRIVIHLPAPEQVTPDPELLTLIDERLYGGSKVLFYSPSAGHSEVI